MKRILLVLAGLQVADGLLTRSAVGRGVVTEWNSLVSAMAGEWSFVILKVVGAVTSALALWVVYRRFPQFAAAGAAFVILFYGAVLAWNVTTIIRA